MTIYSGTLTGNGHFIGTGALDGVVEDLTETVNRTLDLTIDLSNGTFTGTIHDITTVSVTLSFPGTPPTTTNYAPQDSGVQSISGTINLSTRDALFATTAGGALDTVTWHFSSDYATIASTDQTTYNSAGIGGSITLSGLLQGSSPTPVPHTVTTIGDAYARVHPYDDGNLLITVGYDRVIHGTYGTLNVTSDGTWTYKLDSGGTSLTTLAHDEFDIAATNGDQAKLDITVHPKNTVQDVINYIWAHETPWDPTASPFRFANQTLLDVVEMRDYPGLNSDPLLVAADHYFQSIWNAALVNALGSTPSLAAAAPILALMPIAYDGMKLIADGVGGAVAAGTGVNVSNALRKLFSDSSGGTASDPSALELAWAEKGVLDGVTKGWIQAAAQARGAVAVDPVYNVYQLTTSTGTQDVAADALTTYHIISGPTLPTTTGDTIIFDNLANTPLNLDNGNHLVFVAFGGKTINMGNGSNSIFLLHGNHTLNEGTGNNTITGGDGLETITVGSGTNAFYGGSGGMVLVFSGLRSEYRIGANQDGSFAIYDTRASHANGSTLASHVTAFKFADGTVTAAHLLDQPGASLLKSPQGGVDTYSTGTSTQLTVASTSGVLSNDVDLNGLSLTARLAQAPSHGSLQFNSDGSFSYVPDAGFNGTDTFKYVPVDVVDAPPTSVNLLVGAAATPGLIGSLTPSQQLELIYIGYFDRSADGAGYNFWVGQNTAAQVAGQSAANALKNIANSFAPQPETIAGYPFLANTNVNYSDPTVQSQLGQFINNVYANLFGHGADTGGLSYWKTQIAGISFGGYAPPSTTVGLGEAILTIANGATGADAIAIQNKITVALDFTMKTSGAGLGFPATSSLLAEAKTVLAAVDGLSLNDASVTSAESLTTAWIASQTNGAATSVVGSTNLLSDPAMLS